MAAALQPRCSEFSLRSLMSRAGPIRSSRDTQADEAAQQRIHNTQTCEGSRSDSRIPASNGSAHAASTAMQARIASPAGVTRSGPVVLRSPRRTSNAVRLTRIPTTPAREI